MDAKTAALVQSLENRTKFLKEELAEKTRRLMLRERQNLTTELNLWESMLAWIGQTLPPSTL